MSRTSLRAVSEQLEALGGSAGNGRLREALGWHEETYWRVQEELIGDETIEAGRDRGGSVILASGPKRPAVRPDVVAATRLGTSGDKVVEQFSRFARPLLARMSSSERESCLAAIRDALPPKLISNECA